MGADIKGPVNYGGQAVIEGVMMRGTKTFAVACRTPEGAIVEARENVDSLMAKWKWLHRPFLRGTLAIIDCLVTKTPRQTTNATPPQTSPKNPPQNPTSRPRKTKGFFPQIAMSIL